MYSTMTERIGTTSRSAPFYRDLEERRREEKRGEERRREERNKNKIVIGTVLRGIDGEFCTVHISDSFRRGRHEDINRRTYIHIFFK